MCKIIYRTLLLIVFGASLSFAALPESKPTTLSDDLQSIMDQNKTLTLLQTFIHKEPIAMRKVMVETALIKLLDEITAQLTLSASDANTRHVELANNFSSEHTSDAVLKRLRHALRDDPNFLHLLSFNQNNQAALREVAVETLLLSKMHAIHEIIAAQK